MLRISKKADYAVFLLGAIARQGAYPGGSAGDCHVLEVLPDHSHAHCVTEHVAEPAATRRKPRAQR